MISLSSDISDQARHWRNRNEVRAWCRQHTLISKDEHKRWLDGLVNDKTVKMFGIVHDGVDVGVCGFTSINYINRSAEFSLYIGPEYHKQGFGTAGLNALVKHGFLAFGFNRIWGETFDGNPAVKTFTKVGMIKEGTLRHSYFKQGKFINSHIYSILAPDFFAMIKKADQ